MEQCDDGFHTVFPAAADDLPVVFDLLVVEYIFLRLNSGPLNREAISIQPGVLHQPNVLGVSVVVVAGNAAFLPIGGMGHLLLGSAVGVCVIPLHLMSSGSGTNEEVLWGLGCNDLSFVTDVGNEVLCRDQFGEYCPLLHLPLLKSHLFQISVLFGSVRNRFS